MVLRKSYLTNCSFFGLLVGMPVRKKTSTASAQISSVIPRKVSQQQILYTLLLIATFLVGYLLATVQALKAGPQAPSNPGTAAVPQPSTPPGNDPNKVYEISPGRLPIKGREDAKVTIIEFADFRCPFCEKVFSDVEPQIMKDYVDTGKAKFAFRHYAFLGPASLVAAHAAECANEQGKFWEMYDYLFKNQPPESDTTMYNSDTLSQAAGSLGMDAGQFKGCVDSKKYQKEIDADQAAGQKASVNATPTFFINGKQILGAQPYESFKTAIEAALAAK